MLDDRRADVHRVNNTGVAPALNLRRLIAVSGSSDPEWRGQQTKRQCDGQINDLQDPMDGHA